MGKTSRLPDKFFRRGQSPYIYYRASETLQVSTRLKNAAPSELYSWLADWKAKQLLSRNDKHTQEWTAAQWYPEFLSAKRAERTRKGFPYARSTFDNYARAVAHLEEEAFWSRIPLSDVDNKVAQRFIEAHEYDDDDPEGECGFDPLRDIRFLKTLKNWAIKHGDLRAKPITIPTPVGNGSKAGRRLTHEELVKIEAEVAASRSPTAKIQYSLGRLVGMRSQEVKKLQAGWVKLVDGTPSICIPAEFTKNRQYREVPIPEGVRTDILDLCRGKSATAPIFSASAVYFDKRNGVGTWWREVKKRAGVKCRFHDLRITSATEMAESGVPQAVAMDLLGHDKEVNDIYVKTLSMRKKAEALRQVAEAKSYTGTYTV
jgi:hypothetical protein